MATIVSVEPSETCAAFANGKTLCLPVDLFRGDSSTLVVGECILVRFTGEGAEPKWFESEDCPEATER